MGKSPRRTGRKQAVVKLMMDGEWRTAAQIRESLTHESLKGAHHAMYDIRYRPPSGLKCEVDRQGPQMRFRLVEDGGRWEEFRHYFEPLVSELEEMAGGSVARLSLGLLKNLAARMRRELERK